jgi:hypothetical protein
MTIQTSAPLSAGSHSIAVAAARSTPTPTQTAIIKLIAGSVASSLGSSSLDISRSASAGTSIVTTATNFTGNVAFSVSGLPFGVNYTLSPATVAGSGSTSLVITAASTAKPGTYTVLVQTAAGGTVAISALTLIIS